MAQRVVYNRDGFDGDGFDERGYNKVGYNKFGLDARSCHDERYDTRSYDEKGFDEKGFDKWGYDCDNNVSPQFKEFYEKETVKDIFGHTGKIFDKLNKLEPGSWEKSDRDLARTKAIKQIKSLLIQVQHELHATIADESS